MADYSAEALSRTLIQTDLPLAADEAYLHALYSSTGQLVSARLARNAAGTSEGYAYLEFASAQTADGVLRGYQGHPIPGTDAVFKLVSAGAAASSSADAGGPDHSVFVGDLAPDVSDYVLTDKFRQYFPSVRSAKVITDPVTGRSKGYGFVRFGSESERDRALGEMAGHLISNRPIRVSVATAKKNTSTVSTLGTLGTAAASSEPHPSDYDPTNTTLFIGGLSAAVSEEELQAQFGRFGDIIYVKIPPGKGCGFVQYVHRSVAEVALSTMQGQNIGGSSIRISWGRSSSRSAPAVAAAAASPYPSYGSSPYGGAYADPYAAAYGAAAANPYAAAYPAYSQAPDYSAYQAAYQQTPVAATPAQAATPAAMPLSNGYAASHSMGTGASGAPKLDLRDPLASLDIKKLNAEYIQRHQAVLLGNFLQG